MRERLAASVPPHAVIWETFMDYGAKAAFYAFGCQGRIPPEWHKSKRTWLAFSGFCATNASDGREWLKTAPKSRDKNLGPHHGGAFFGGAAVGRENALVILATSRIGLGFAYLGEERRPSRHVACHRQRFDGAGARSRPFKKLSHH